MDIFDNVTKSFFLMIMKQFGRNFLLWVQTSDVSSALKCKNKSYINFCGISFVRHREAVPGLISPLEVAAAA